jgi:hypothetical protein
MVRSKSGLRLIPEFYAVPRDKVELEQVRTCLSVFELKKLGRFKYPKLLILSNKQLF